MKIILDTNFLIYCSKKKIDYVNDLSNLINDNYEIVIPKQVINELIRITQYKKKKIPLLKRKPRFKKTTGRDKDAALLTLQIIDKKLKENELKEIFSKGENLDEVILKLANENPSNIVCTLDKEMRKRLRRVILLNKNGRLILTG